MVAGRLGSSIQVSFIKTHNNSTDRLRERQSYLACFNRNIRGESLGAYGNIRAVENPQCRALLYLYLFPINKVGLSVRPPCNDQHYCFSLIDIGTTTSLQTWPVTGGACHHWCRGGVVLACYVITFRYYLLWSAKRWWLGWLCSTML